jgi:hypothetical protein
MGNIDGTPKIALGASADAIRTDTGTGFYADGTGSFKVGSTTKYIKFEGSDVDIKAGTFDLNTTNLRVSSSYGGTIAMGKTIPKSISGSGVFLSGSGDFLAGNHAGNKIQYNKEANAIVMKANAFSLDATTIVIDSSANDGKIALGASPNSSVAGTNPGIYMDGTGDFLAYGDASNLFKKDGTALTIKAETFNLKANTDDLVIDSAGHSISLAAGNITLDGTDDGFFEIGTLADTSTVTGTLRGFRVDGLGNMLLKAADASTNYIKFDVDGAGSALEIKTADFEIVSGNVTMKGVVTADTGHIGGTNGWTIASGKMHSGTNITFDAGTDEVQIDGSGALGMYFGPSGELNNSAENATGSFWITQDDFSRQIFRVGSKHKYIKFDSDDGLEIATPNFTASAAGDVTMQGTITATAGNIGDWVITGSNMESDTDFYRGMKLIPNDKFVGYGNTVHKIQTISGSFSFGVAPPPGGGSGNTPPGPPD